MLEKLQQILADQFGVDANSITSSTTFVEDLGADSLDMVDVLMTLEDEFDIGEVDEETAATVHTVGDVLRIIGEDV